MATGLTTGSAAAIDVGKWVTHHDQSELQSLHEEQSSIVCVRWHDGELQTLGISHARSPLQPIDPTVRELAEEHRKVPERDPQEQPLAFYS